MVERQTNEYGRGNVNLSKFKYLGFPIGKFLSMTSIMSHDRESEDGLFKARNELNERGLIILDVRHSRFDAAATGFNLLKELNIDKMIIPSSIKNLKNPILSHFYTEIKNIEGLELFPTYRKQKYVSDDEFSIYKNMSEEERIQNNYAYVERAIEILKEPRSIVFLAAYGGFNKPKNGSIPQGIEIILKTGNPALCTLSVYSDKFFPITTYFSENLLYFNKNFSNQEMFSEIVDSHIKIAKRIGFDLSYFNDYNYK